MTSERMDLFGNHYTVDECRVFADFSKPLGVLKTLGWFILNLETPSSFLRYGLYGGFKFRGIAQEGLRDIQAFVKQGGTQVEHPLVLTPPAKFDANNYPLGTYLKTYTDLHCIFSPEIPDFIMDGVRNNPPSFLHRLQVKGTDHIESQFVSVGVVVQSPISKEKLVICSYGSDMQILQGRHGYNSLSKSFRIGEWGHLPIQGHNFLGVARFDIFFKYPKMEILQAGETEIEKVPAGKKIFVLT